MDLTQYKTQKPRLLTLVVPPNKNVCTYITQHVNDMIVYQKLVFERAGDPVHADFCDELRHRVLNLIKKEDPNPTGIEAYIGLTEDNEWVEYVSFETKATCSFSIIDTKFYPLF